MEEKLLMFMEGVWYRIKNYTKSFFFRLSQTQYVQRILSTIERYYTTSPTFQRVCRWSYKVHLYFEDHYHRMVAFGLMLAIILGSFAFYPGQVLGATYTFTQSSWQSATSNTATHPTNQNSWTQYSAKDTGINLVNSGLDISLSTATYTVTDDGTLTTTGSATGGGFGNGTNSNTTVSGSGSSASIGLTGTNTTLNAWDTVYPAVPAVVGVGGSMIRYATEDSVYVLRGGSTTGFYKYSISTNTWTTLTSVPGTVGAGASMIRNGADNDIYVTRGDSSTGFYKYSISGNSWTTLTVVPGTVNTGGAMIRNGSDNDIYVMAGNGTNFYKYSISGNSWTTLAVVPGTVGNGGRIIRNGADNDIYVMQGNSGTGFYKYSISGNSWTTLTVIPGAVSSGGSMVRNSSDNDIYILAGGNGTNFYKYSISGNSWATLTVVPGAVGNGASMIRNGSDNDIYVTRGGGNTSFYKYSISGNSWTTLTVVPGTVDIGGAMIRNSSDNDIYLLGGGTTLFVKYSISGNSWSGSATSNLTSTPASIGSGSAMIRNSTDNDIYVLRGGGTTGFYKYSISGNSWTTLTAVPAAVQYGRNIMIRNGSDNDIYVLPGNGSNVFYKYSISGNSWTTLTVAPGAVGTNAFMIRNGSDNDIYVLPGNSSTGFYKYSISGNSWTTLTAVPGTVSNGGFMIRNGSDNDIYVLPGGSTGFYKYSISGNSWTTLTAVPAAVAQGGNMIRNASDNDIYLISGNNGTGFYKYSISGNSWTTLVAVPGSVYTGGAMMRSPSGNDIYVLSGNSLTDFYKFIIQTTTYPSSGTFTSAVIDLGTIAPLQTASFTSSVPTNTTLTVDVRAGDTASPDGTWTSWLTGVSNGGSLTTLGSKRYVQYRVNMATTNTSVTPSLDNLMIEYQAYPASSALTSNAFNGVDPSTIMGALSWDEDTTLPSGTGVTVSLRTASTAGGLSSASWSNFTNSTTNCSKSVGVVTCSNSAIPSGMKDGSGDQYFQYKVTLTSTGANAPTVSEVRVQYVVNATPEFDATFGTNGVLVSQISDSNDAQWGKVSIQYKVRDPDTSGGTNTPGVVTPSFEYNTGSGWTTITSGFLSSGALSNKSVGQSDYTTYTAYWDARSQISGIYASTTQIRVTINDNELAQNTASATGNSIALDTKTPTLTIGTASISGGSIRLNITDDTNANYTLSNNADLSADGVNASSGTAQTVSTLGSDISVSWTFPSSEYPKVYVKVADSFGNSATSTIVVPVTPSNFDLRDLSNINAGDYREFISWKLYVATTSATFSKYELYRSVNGTDYSLLSTITSQSTNYYFDSSVSSSTTYYYKVRTVDTDGDSSQYSSVVSDAPNGQGGTDFSPPAISNVVVSPVQATWATVTWTTDELSNSVVQYSLASGGPSWQTQTNTAMVTDHSVTISGLTPNTAYIIRVKSTDPLNNETIDDASGAYYTLTTLAGATITDVVVRNINNSSAEIEWNTNQASDSHVIYATNLSNVRTNTSTSDAGTDTLVTTDTGGVYQHRVVLSGLSQQTTYYFYVKSTNASSDIVTDINNGDYYTFTTTYDSQAPVISHIDEPVLTNTGAVITWRTDELADGYIVYGTSSGSYTASTTLDTSLTTSHAVTLSGLSATTAYYYKIYSSDAQSNQAVSSEQTFTTTSPGESQIVYITSSGGGSGSGVVTDMTPPTISDYNISDVNAFGATVRFSTNEKTVGFANVSAGDESLGSMGSSIYATSHEIRLKSLVPDTQYTLKIKAIDQSGNEREYVPTDSFRTKFIVESLEDIVETPDVTELQKKLENIIEQTTPSLVPPFISDLIVKDVTENTATVEWNTNIPALSTLSFGSASEFASGAYGAELSETDAKVKKHSFILSNLKPFTEYHIQAKSYVFPKAARKSRDVVFNTKAQKLTPEIVRVGNVDAEIRWATEREADSFVEYKNVKTGKVSRVGDPAFLKTHQVKIEDLTPKTVYDVRVSSTDAQGNTVDSSVVRITTDQDTVAPRISGEKIVNALLPSKKESLQTVISWMTDEPSNTEVYYEEGVGNLKDELKNKLSKDIEYTTEHVIILTTLKPGTVYRVQMKSADEAGNIASTTVRTILTPNQTESVVDIMIKNFEKSFGFIKNVNR